MSAYIPRLAATAPTDQLVSGLEEHGTVIVEGVIAAAAMFSWRCNSRSLNPRSAAVYGADGHETIDALPSLRLRKRERHKVLR